MADLEEQEKVVVVAMAAEEEKEEEKEGFLGEMAVLDFDMLFSTVALQSHGKWRKLQTFEDDERGSHGNDEFGGVLRMWEGELLDCFEDRRIAIESSCCPCYRFGKNMRRAGFGSCFLQGTMHFVLVFSTFLSCVAFIVTKWNCFLYLSIGLTISAGIYLGFFRTQMKKKFNIRGSNSSLDDCIYHLICPCCTLCQESRTLEMNNVQDGIWHGRGDTICIGSVIDGRNAFFELQPPPFVSPIVPESHNAQTVIDINDKS